MKSDIVNRNENNQLHGIQIEYYDNDNGQIRYKKNYINGKQHGEQVCYHDNGQIMYKENYINGKYHGKQIGYYNYGQIMYKNDYINGKLVSQEEWVAYERRSKLTIIKDL
jgi:antitoxin component YwqK of YwqJK toxin-antitoxin module